MLKLRIPNHVGRTYVVGVVRTGKLTVSTVIGTVNGRPMEVRQGRPGTDRIRAQPLPRRPVRPVPCAGRGPFRCCLLRRARRPARSPTPTCPSWATINRPWVGTDPVLAPPQHRGHHLRQGRLHPVRCTPRDHPHLPDPAEQAAQALRHHRDRRRSSPSPRQGHMPSWPASLRRWRRCEKKDLGAKVSSEVDEPRGYRRSRVRPVAAGQRDQREVERGLLDGCRPGAVATSPR